MFLRKALFLTGGVFLAACAPSGSRQVMPSQPLPDRSFRVSVESGGKPIENFEENLIHRITLTDKDVDTALASPSGGLNLPFELTRELDSTGAIKGLRVVSIQPGRGSLALGFRRGDVVTAVNKIHLKQPSELRTVFESMRERKLVSITLERAGVPHKILLYPASGLKAS